MRIEPFIFKLFSDSFSSEKRVVFGRVVVSLAMIYQLGCILNFFFLLIFLLKMGHYFVGAGISS